MSADPSSFQLNNGQSMFGRTINYKLPASQSTGYPIFIGSIEPHGDNVLDSFEMLNSNGVTTYAVNIINANNIAMNNLLIGEMNNQTGYKKPIQIENGENIILKNSIIYAFANRHPNDYASGIYNDSGSITVSGNTFNIIVNPVRSRSLESVGIINTGTAVINNNIFNVTVNSKTRGADYTAIGISNTGIAVLSNNIFNVEAIASVGNNIAKGVQNSGGEITLNNNTFNVLASEATHDQVFGINGTGVTGNNNVFTLTSPEGQITPGSITGNNNKFICNGDPANCL